MAQPVSPGQLSLLDPGPLSPQPAPEVLSPAVAGAISASRSDATRRAYSGQWRQFVAWAGDAGVPWLPAAPVDVAEYLTALVGRGVGIATVRQAVSAIGAAHRAAGADSPTESEVVRLTMAGLSRQNRRPAVQAPALLDDAVETILATARSPRERDRRGMENPGRAAQRGVVDIALVLILRDCGLRRSEAVALVWSDIERWDDGSGRLLIERSKTDQTGEGEVVFITHRAMTALDELRRLRGDANPSVFGMTANTINRRVKAAAKAAGLGEGFSGHSGRVGLARRMARAGAPDSAIMRQGRWSSSTMVAKYTRGESAGDAARWLE